MSRTERRNIQRYRFLLLLLHCSNDHRCTREKCTREIPQCKSDIPGAWKISPGSTLTDQYVLADDGDGLAGRRGGEVDGQVREAEDAHERLEPLLRHELPAVVVCRVVAQDRLHELHLPRTKRAAFQSQEGFFCGSKACETTVVALVLCSTLFISAQQTKECNAQTKLPCQPAVSASTELAASNTASNLSQPSTIA